MVVMNGFRVSSLKHKIAMLPHEDAFEFNLKNKYSMAVADGITRDPCVFLPDLNSFFGLLNWVWNYPRPSPAANAAKLFVEFFNKCTEHYPEKNQETVRYFFKIANMAIGKYNRVRGLTSENVDFTIDDYAGCVASGVLIDRDRFFYGFVSDCGVSLFGAEKKDFVFATENQGPDKHGQYINAERKRRGFSDWRAPQSRIITRSQFRNNPDEEHSYGALTGQQEAMYYVITGVQELRKGDVVLAYSDGLAGLLCEGRAIDYLREGDFGSLRKYCRREVRTEGALTYFSND